MLNDGIDRQLQLDPMKSYCVLVRYNVKYHNHDEEKPLETTISPVSCLLRNVDGQFRFLRQNRCMVGKYL